MAITKVTVYRSVLFAVRLPADSARSADNLEAVAGRPIYQFCFLPPIIARSVFSQEDR